MFCLQVRADIARAVADRSHRLAQGRLAAIEFPPPERDFPVLAQVDAPVVLGVRHVGWLERGARLRWPRGRASRGKATCLVAHGRKLCPLAIPESSANALFSSIGGIQIVKSENSYRAVEKALPAWLVKASFRRENRSRVPPAGAGGMLRRCSPAPRGCGPRRSR